MFSETSDFHPFSSCLTYSRARLGAHRTPERVKGCSVDLSQFPHRDLGQVSKTCPEKLASYEEIRGVNMMIIFSVTRGWAYDEPFWCFGFWVGIFSSYIIKIHKLIITGIDTLIPQICTEHVQYSWCCATC